MLRRCSVQSARREERKRDIIHSLYVYYDVALRLLTHSTKRLIDRPRLPNRQFARETIAVHISAMIQKSETAKNERRDKV